MPRVYLFYFLSLFVYAQLGQGSYSILNPQVYGAQLKAQNSTVLVSNYQLTFVSAPSVIEVPGKPGTFLGIGAVDGGGSLGNVQGIPTSFLSTDLGQTWVVQTTISLNRSHYINNTNFVIGTGLISSSRIFAIWWSAVGLKFYFSSTVDGGASWTVPSAISWKNFSNIDYISARFDVSTNGTIVMVINSVTMLQQDYDIHSVRSGDGGSSWTYPIDVLGRFVNDNNVSDDAPDVAAGANGRWVMVWNSNFYGNDFDIFSIFSLDDGQTWSQNPVQVNYSGVNDSYTDMSPSITSNRMNLFLISWNNQGVAGTDMDVLRAWSNDGTFWNRTDLVNDWGQNDTINDYDFFPEVFYAGGAPGIWLITWYNHSSLSRSPDASSCMTWSIDDGVTWTSSMAALPPFSISHRPSIVFSATFSLLLIGYSNQSVLNFTAIGDVNCSTNSTLCASSCGTVCSPNPLLNGSLPTPTITSRSSPTFSPSPIQAPSPLPSPISTSGQPPRPAPTPPSTGPSPSSGPSLSPTPVSSPAPIPDPVPAPIATPFESSPSALLPSPSGPSPLPRLFGPSPVPVAVPVPTSSPLTCGPLPSNSPGAICNNGTWVVNGSVIYPPKTILQNITLNITGDLSGSSTSFNSSSLVISGNVSLTGQTTLSNSVVIVDGNVIVSGGSLNIDSNSSQLAISGSLTLSSASVSIGNASLSIQGCLNLGDNSSQLTIHLDSYPKSFVLPFQCVNGHFAQITAISDNACVLVQSNPTYNSTLLNVAFVYSHSLECEKEDSVWSSGVIGGVAASIAFVVLVIFIIIILAVPSLRRRVFPFRDRERFVRTQTTD